MNRLNFVLFFALTALIAMGCGSSTGQGDDNTTESAVSGKAASDADRSSDGGAAPPSEADPATNDDGQTGPFPEPWRTGGQGGPLPEPWKPAQSNDDKKK